MRKERSVKRVVIFPDHNFGYWLNKKTWNLLSPNKRNKFKELRQAKKMIRLTYYWGVSKPTVEEESMQSK